MKKTSALLLVLILSLSLLCVGCSPAGKEPGEVIKQVGKPIVYGVAIPKSTPNEELSIAFINYLIDKEKGLSIMSKNGQLLVAPLVIKGK